MLYMYFLSYRNYLTVIGVRKRLSFLELQTASQLVNVTPWKCSL